MSASHVRVKIYLGAVTASLSEVYRYHTDLTWYRDDSDPRGGWWGIHAREEWNSRRAKTYGVRKYLPKLEAILCGLSIRPALAKESA